MGLRSEVEKSKSGKVEKRKRNAVELRGGGAGVRKGETGDRRQEIKNRIWKG